MRGGMKVYSRSAAAARAYLEADRGGADDYYLTEGTGLARRFVARDGRVAERAPLTGETYEAWVAGRDPDTGSSRGRLRTDEHAVRFVEVVVNGPKSWSLAAALHEDVAAAYDAAQDRAAVQIIGWLAAHATTRVGPRGGQVQVPVEILEAVTVRHYTSRAGDPHRHLHLQIGARVFAAGKWRGLHTVGCATSSPPSTGSGMPRSPVTRRSGPRSARHRAVRSASERGVTLSARPSAHARTSHARRSAGPGGAGVRGPPVAFVAVQIAPDLPRPRAERTDICSGLQYFSSGVEGVAVGGQCWPPSATASATSPSTSPRPRSAHWTARQRRSACSPGSPPAAPPGTRPTCAARPSNCSPPTASSPSRRCASNWPRISPPGPWPAACRCWSGTAHRSTLPSTSGPGRLGRCSTSKPS